MAVAEEFERTKRLYLERDDHGRVRALWPDDRNRPTVAQLPQLSATEFLTVHADVLGFDRSWLTGAALDDEPTGSPDGIELRFDGENTQFDTTTVSYQQTYEGIPVWRCGATVTVRESPARVAAVQSTVEPAVHVERGPAAGVTTDTTASGLDMIGTAFGAVTKTKARRTTSDKRPEVDIVSDRRVIYHYDLARRLTDFPAADEPIIEPPFPIPDPPDLTDGTFRDAREIIFRATTSQRGVLTWLALVDINTGALLLLRPFAAHVNGLVFNRDPITSGSTALPNATAATLNPLRTSVLLRGLVAPAPGADQTLGGDNVRITDFEPATVAPPARPAGSNFDFAARTSDFAAVNAYVHNDWFFRFVTDLGFARASYFNGTTFPVPVDHRGRFGSTDGIEINASCSGNGTGGIANVDYELADLGDVANPIGLATDFRVMLHELGGHGILYDHVNFANLGFAHSIGDSFAAIVCAPDTQAPDRFLTFPWVAAIIDRRHDRSIGAGWGWGGSNDVGGYSTEQILSTTHFRVYRSLGGDSTSIDMRRFASQVTAYLLLRAIGTLTPSTNPSNVTGWVTALRAADTGDWTPLGLTGGAYFKVIRWAFEKQGLYQGPGAPTPTSLEGTAPAVDVYIDDGRRGEYQFQAVHWNNQNVWNRRYADAGTLNEEPWLGRPNFAYCRVRNRGTQTATGVTVRAFHCNPGVGLTWPDDWQTMTTPSLTVPNIPPGGEATVGPFTWTPSQPDHECLLMVSSAIGDPSNIDAFGPGESIPEWRLVPHDNNIGQRNVHPVPAAGGIQGIVDVLGGRQFTIRNPFPEAVRILVDIALPPTLVRAGWEVGLSSPGGSTFGLAPGQSRLARLSVTAGGPIDLEALRVSDDRDVVVSVTANGILIGGMSYHLDPEESKPASQDDDGHEPGPDNHPAQRCTSAVDALLECLDAPRGTIRNVCVKHVIIDVEFC